MLGVDVTVLLLKVRCDQRAAPFNPNISVFEARGPQ
jgi:hypothetical protein